MMRIKATILIRANIYIVENYLCFFLISYQQCIFNCIFVIPTVTFHGATNCGSENAKSKGLVFLFFNIFDSVKKKLLSLFVTLIDIISFLILILVVAVLLAALFGIKP